MDKKDVSRRLNVELSNCQKWLVDNKLSLHVGKTECMLFGSRNKLKRAGDFQVFCEGKAVQRVSQVKYLGVILDETLSGFAHVSGVVKTCVGRLAFLYCNSSLI